MRIEKISNDQIRCTLSQQDLEDRHIHITELAYGSPKAKSFFNDMMQQASYELGFDTKNIPLMIEAIPASDDSIVLVISKVNNTNELDGHYSAFTRNENDDPENSFKYNNFEDDEFPSLSFLDNFEDEDEDEDEEDTDEDEDVGNTSSFYSDVNRSGMSARNTAWNQHHPDKTGSGSYSRSSSDHAGPGSYYKNSPNQAGNVALSKTAGMDHRPVGTGIPASKDIIKVYSFKDLDSLFKLASQLIYSYSGQNTLYKDEKEHKFYLVLHKSEHTSIQFTRICNTISEYGVQENNSYAAASVYEEHFKPFIKDTALQVLASI